jgi:hypothetical protein
MPFNLKSSVESTRQLLRSVGSERRIALHCPNTVHPVHIATIQLRNLGLSITATTSVTCAGAKIRYRPGTCSAPSSRNIAKIESLNGNQIQLRILGSWIRFPPHRRMINCRLIPSGISSGAVSDLFIARISKYRSECMGRSGVDYNNSAKGQSKVR